MSDHPPIAHDQIQEALERILASRGFANAGRLSRLLRHIVNRTLAGQADQLKEYSVGMEVFDRDDKYDPRVDSIVRVEAGRLRSRLDEYYAGEGATDAIRISLPRGAYVAQFEPRAEPPPAVAPPAAAPAAVARRTWAAWAVSAGAIALALALVTWLGWSPAAQGPASVAVLAFEQYSAADEDGAVAAQLTDNVTAELARLGTVSVVSHTSAMQFAGQRKPLKEIAGALNAGYLVEASIENEGSRIRVTARLVSAATDRKVWVEDFVGSPGDMRTLSRQIAAAVSGAALGTRAPAP